MFDFASMSCGRKTVYLARKISEQAAITEREERLQSGQEK